MRVQTKLTALLCAIMVVFFVGLGVNLRAERDRAASLLNSERELKAEFFDRLVRLYGASLRTYANDYTYWDEMVRFVATGDPKWAAENIQTALSTYNATSTWVCRTDFSVVYGLNILDDPRLDALPLPRETLKRVFSKTLFPHFFVPTASGLLEIRGAPIQPSSDVERTSQPRGFFLAGRLWSDTLIGELADLTELEIRLHEGALSASAVSKSLIEFQRTLSGWDGAPVRTLRVRGESAILREFWRAANQQWVLLLTFSVVLLLGLTVVLARWVTRPLRLISQSLHTESPDIPPLLRMDRSEFGRLAQMIAEFVRQKAELADEVMERNKAEQALRKSEERYALAARGTNEGLWDWNLATDEVFFSPRWKEMLGYTEGEIGTHVGDWFTLVHPDDLERLKGELAAHCSGQIVLFEREHRMLHKNGTYRWVLSRGVALKDAEGYAYRMAGSLSDITDLSMHDSLTGLPNRLLFLERLQRGLLRSRRNTKYLFAVVLLDLDRFKLVNESLGHVAGDQLLVEVSRRLERCLRPEDTIARFGGDEFTLLLDDLHHISDAIRVADRVQAVLANPCQVGDSEVVTTASLGIVVSSAAYNRPEELLRDADTALHRAKALGKARHEVFAPDMRSLAVTRLSVESDLRRAVKHNEFVLYYQPIVSLASQQLVGFEALIRWMHPERGLVAPMEFIPVAEESGLIVPIGWWVLDTAARQLAEWQRGVATRGSLNMRVNLSTKQLNQRDLLQCFEQTLTDHAVSPGTLKIEITESVLMADPVAAAATLGSLRTLGVGVAIDDFGTGYSSLAYLHKFPINTMKIDRSFVTAMKTDEGMALVRTIITLAHGLKMDVVAEGVETCEQAEHLHALACEFAQGFLYSKPLPPKEAETLIDTSLVRTRAA